MRTKTILSIAICLSFFQFSYAQGKATKNYINFTLEDKSIELPPHLLKYSKKLGDYKTFDSDTLVYKIKDNFIFAYSSKKSKKPIYKGLSIGKNNYAIFEFKKKLIKDVNGVDLYVFGENLQNKNTIYLSKDGEVWKKVDEVNQDKQYVDLSKVLTSKEKFTYLKIVNQNSLPIKIFQVAFINSKKKPIGIQTRIKNGKVYTTSNKVKLQLKDFKRFDWDMISVKINGKVISKRKLLTKQNRFINLELKKGINKIIITARNEGLRFPNTVDIKVVDGIIINIGTYRINKRKSKSLEIIRVDEFKGAHESG